MPPQGHQVKPHLRPRRCICQSPEIRATDRRFARAARSPITLLRKLLLGTAWLFALSSWLVPSYCMYSTVPFPVLWRSCSSLICHNTTPSLPLLSSSLPSLTSISKVTPRKRPHPPISVLLCSYLSYPSSSPPLFRPLTHPKSTINIMTDAFTPSQTIELISRTGAKKAHMRLDKLFINSCLSGPLLGFGCAVLVSVNASPWYQENAPGLIRMLGAMIFPIGLVMIVISVSLGGGRAGEGRCCVEGKEGGGWRGMERWRGEEVEGKGLCEVC